MGSDSLRTTPKKLLTVSVLANPRSAIGNIVTIVVMIYGSRKPTITDGKIALQAVSLYTKLCSFSAVASALGLHSNSVQTYVSKMAVYGVAILSLPKLIQPFDGMRIAENWE